MLKTLSFDAPPNHPTFAENINQQKTMIDISQLTALISAFRVETEKSAIKREQCQTRLNIAEREQIIKICD